MSKYRIVKDLQDLDICFYTDKESIILKNLIPESLDYSYSPNYSAQNTLGRLSPIQIYSGGSAKEYSFALTIHEDMAIDMGYESIVELVESIKKLSYPILDKTTKILTLPRVTFVIGEISGVGIIKTSLNWKKPFRDGRFVIVEIGVSITVEVEYQPPRITKRILRETDNVNILYSNKIRVIGDFKKDQEAFLYESAIFNDSSGHLIYGNLRETAEGSSILRDTSIGNLILTSKTDLERQYDVNHTTDYIDKSKDIFDLLSSGLGSVWSGDKESLDGLNNYIGILDELSDEVSRYASSGFVSTNDEIEAMLQALRIVLDGMKKQTKEAITHYYKNIDRNMTKEKYNKMVDESDERIEEIYQMVKAVYSYGKSS